MDEVSFRRALDEFPTWTVDQQEEWISTRAATLSAAQLNEVSLVVGELYRGSTDPDIATASQRLTDALKGARSVSDRATEDQAQRDEVQSRVNAGEITEVQANDILGGGELTQEQIQLYELFGGRQPTDEQVQRLIDLFNLTHDANVDTWEELVVHPEFEDPAVAQAARVIGAEGDEPFENSYTYTSFSGKDVTVRRGEMENAMSMLSINDPKDLDPIIKLADRYGLTRADGTGVAWQPLAALLQYDNYFGAERDRRRSQSAEMVQEYYAKKKELDNWEASGGPRGAEYGQLKREVDALRRQLDSAATDPTNIQTVLTPRQRAMGFQEGMATYNDPFFAFFHALDEGLAARLHGAMGEDGEVNLSATDAQIMGQYISQATGGSDITDFINNMVGVAYGEAAGQLSAKALGDYLQLVRNMMNGGGGTGRQRILPDPVQIRQAAADMYQQLFLSEADDATLDRFTSQIQSAISGAPEDQDVDVNARIRDIAEGMPEYQELYGNKPAGISEQQYQNQFLGARQSILGAEIGSADSVRLGMKSGKYQTTVGAAAASAEAFDNSTFMGRLARAANAVSRNT